MDTFIGRDLICVRGERQVFSGLSFELRSGGVLTLIGPNGSGKSSLLRLMAGLLSPFAGLMVWNGVGIQEDRDAHRKRVAHVGHQDAVKPVLTVRENLDFWATATTGGADGADAALDSMGIRYLAEVPGRFLSAGQKRRLNLARLLVSQAPLWLLDEPTTALDVHAIGALRSAVRNHRDKGGMVAVSTHSDLAIDDASVLELGLFSPGREAA